MLKKMRWRFIGSAMAAITAVVVVLLFVLNIGNYRNITRQQDEALDRLLEIESLDAPFSDGRGAPPFDDWMHFSPEVQYSLRFFSVHVQRIPRADRGPEFRGLLPLRAAHSRNQSRPFAATERPSWNL